MDRLASIVQVSESAAHTARLAQRKAREHAVHLSSIMRETAETLEKSATLADEHALRHERAGDRQAAAEERRVATRAREAAHRARGYANQWQPRAEQ